MTAGELGELGAQPGSDRGARAVEGIVVQVSAFGGCDRVRAGGLAGRFGRPGAGLRAGLVQLLFTVAGLGLGLLLPRITVARRAINIA